MSLSRSLSRDVRESLRTIVNIDKQLDVIDKKLEIRESTVKGSGEGLFASERIPKGTIFLSAGDINNYDTISRKINDLSYHGTTKDYETDDNVTKNINVGYLVKMDWMCQFFGSGKHEIFLRAIKDIEEGEELSRILE